MECGTCAYVCPAKKKLVQKHKMAKDLLNKYKKQKNKGG
jgi:Na+-translocating ferredoxin:NAD+ oxidoreductase RnfC subunit